MNLDYYDAPNSFPTNCTFTNSTSMVCKHSFSLKGRIEENAFVEQLVARMTNNIYYHNFISNFFMYSLNGANFKKIFRALCCRIK